MPAHAPLIWKLMKDFKRVRGLDPNAFWLLDLAKETFLPEPRPIPVITTLYDQDAVDAFNGLPTDDLAPPKPLVLFRDAAPGPAEIGRPLPMLMDMDFLQAVLAFAEKEDGDPIKTFANSDKAIRISAPLGKGSYEDDRRRTYASRRGAPPKPTVLPQGAVVRAIIDDGVGVAHRRFLDEKGESRVLCHWNMGGKHVPSSRVAFGREHSKADINARLQARKGPGGRVDEDAVYRDLGLIDPASDLPSVLSLRRAHGTHVLDAFAGEEPGAPDAAPLIVVQLPPAVVADSSGALLDAHLAAGLEYIRDRAALFKRLGKDGGQEPVPVAVNVSYGATAGAHDGSSAIERLMDQLIEGAAGRMEIVLAAGNSHLSSLFAQAPAPKLAAPKATHLTWRLSPDDRTPSALELWMPPGMPQARANLQVTAPGGQESPTLGPREDRALVLCKGDQPVFMLLYAIDRDSGRGVFIARMQPTFALNPEAAVAPFGDWRIRIKTAGGLTARHPLRAWIQRDDRIRGYPLAGRQSYFFDPRAPRPGLSEDPDDRRFAIPAGVPVRRESLGNSIATGARTVVAGVYEQRSLRAAAFSAGGPVQTQAGGNLRPDALMPAQASLVAPGLLAAGARSGSVVAMSGTSAAAPLAARLIAEALAAPGGLMDGQSNPIGGRAWIQMLASEAEGRLPSAPNLPPNRGGAGRIAPEDRPYVGRGVAPKHPAKGA